MSIAHHPSHDTITCDAPGCRLNMYNPPDPNRTANERWRVVGGILTPNGGHACCLAHVEAATRGITWVKP